MSIQQNFPAISPSLNLNFARSKTLDPRITFTRTSSATRVNETGLVEVVPANEPRFDHSYDPVSGTVRSLGLLVEEQSTNSLLYSNDFSQNSWTKQNSHPVPTQDVIGPDGVSGSGWRFYRTSTSQYIYQSIIGAGTHTLSAWVRSEEATGDFRMSAYNATNGTMQTSFTATNEWRRFNITISPTVNTNYYPCIPTNTNKNFYVYGAQLELNKSFPTSYIPTTNSTVIRTPDNVSMVGENFSSWYNQSEGTLFASIRNQTVRSSLSYDAFVSIAGTDKDRNVMRIYTQTAPGGGAPYAFFGAVAYSPDGSTVLSHIDTYTSNIQNIGKAALAYKKNDYAFTSHGAIPNTTSSGEVPTCNQLLIFGRSRFQLEPSGHISQLIYYPRRLTNAQLQNLTK